MSGVELTDCGLVVDRDPNRLDELAIDFSRVLSDLDIDHVFVAGYVAILFGRSRSTEDRKRIRSFADAELRRDGEENENADGERGAE